MDEDEKLLFDNVKRQLELVSEICFNLHRVSSALLPASVKNTPVYKKIESDLNILSELRKKKF